MAWIVDSDTAKDLTVLEWFLEQSKKDPQTAEALRFDATQKNDVHVFNNMKKEDNNVVLLQQNKSVQRTKFLLKDCVYFSISVDAAPTSPLLARFFFVF